MKDEHEVIERQRAEGEVRRANAELEALVAERTAQLEAANRALTQEIEQRKQTERNLRTSQLLIQAVLDNAPAVIYVKDLSFRYLLINRRYEEIFNLARQEILGRTDYDFFTQEAATAFRRVDERVLAACQVLTAEEIAPHTDGPHTYISIKAPLRDETGHVLRMFGISTDITERKTHEHTAQTQLERSNQERLRALGQVAGGIAHDINNALSPATLYISMLQQEPSLSMETRANLTIIQHAIDEVSRAVVRMRVLIHGTAP